MNEIADALLDHPRSARLIAVKDTRFGRKYILEGRLSSPDSRDPQVRAIWFAPGGELGPGLVTAYAVAGVEP